MIHSVHTYARLLSNFTVTPVPTATYMPIATLTMVLSACGSDKGPEFVAEQIAEAVSGVSDVDVDLEGNSFSYSVEGENGFKITSGSAASLPEDFPADILIYGDATVVAGTETEGSLSVNLTSDAPAQGVMASYDDYFSRAGWQRTARSQIGDGNGGFLMANFTKEKRNVSLTILHGDDELTHIALITSRD